MIKAQRMLFDSLGMLSFLVLPFKQASLKMIVSRLLTHYQDTHNAKKLRIPGELSLEEIVIPGLKHEVRQQYHLCISGHQTNGEAFISEIENETMVVPVSRRPSFLAAHRPSFNLNSQSKEAEGSSTAPVRELRVGVLGEKDCTLRNSSNLLLLLSAEALCNVGLMNDVREALLMGVHVITVHDKGD